MLQAQLNHAVARATGDDFRVISRRGFSIVNDDSPLDSDDFDDLIADWDICHAEEVTALQRHAVHKEIARRGSADVRVKSKAIRNRRRIGGRRTTAAAH